jgi:hypothetical protein
MAAKEESLRKKRVNRELVLRALTDPRFRKLLQTDPKQVLGKSPTPVNQREVGLVLATVRALESHIRIVADELLCLNGPCGIA